MPRSLKAVLFDFDGTLADSFEAIAASINHVRMLDGLPPLSVSEVKRHVGYGVEHLLSQTVGVGDPAANLNAFKEHHPTVFRTGTHLLPGVAETVRSLHDRGVRLAVCSNKLVEYTRELLSVLNIAAYFDVVVGPENVAHPKPAPDMLLFALSRLNVTAGESLYIGDMTIDVLTGRSAGVTVWVVATGSDSRQTLEKASPDRIFENMTQLAEALEA